LGTSPAGSPTEKGGIPERPPRVGAFEGSRFGLRHLMAGIVVLSLLLTIGRGLGWEVLVLVLLFAPPAVGIGAVVVLIRRRAAMQAGLLWVLSVAARRGLPLAPGVEAFAQMCGGGYRARALYLARLLDSGVALPEAIARTPGALPGDVALSARVGWESGTLADTLRDASAVRAARLPFHRAVVGRLAYLTGVLFAMQTIGTFMMYFITPKFEAIMKDFGIPLPRPTVLLIELSHSLGAGGVLMVFLAELALLLYLPSIYFGRLGLSLPGLDLIFRRRHTAAVVRALAAYVDGGRPLTEGVAALARHYPHWMVRGQLRRVREDLDRGADWLRSLRTRGLLRRGDASLLDVARRAGNLSWALRELAVGIERRQGYRLHAAIQALFPVVVVALGTLVFLFAVGYFAPLITIIESLARFHA
jgi:type II secretory pathway component PulF